jgi:hypothetical protein
MLTNAVIVTGLVAPAFAYFAVTLQIGYAIPMLCGTAVAAVGMLIALGFSPETKGKELVADLQVA